GLYARVVTWHVPSSSLGSPAALGNFGGRGTLVDKAVAAIIQLHWEKGLIPSQTEVVERIWETDEELRKRKRPRIDVLKPAEWREVFGRLSIHESASRTRIEELQKALSIKRILLARSEAEIPKVAAQFFCQIVRPGSRVAFSCGKT